jgi:hypothetical protein
MSEDTDRVAEALERKLAVLTELHDELAACRNAFTGMDLDGIYSHVAAQTLICEKLKALEAEQAAAWQQSTGKAAGAEASIPDLRSWMQSLDPSLAYRVRRTLTSLAILEAEVRHINHAHSVLLEGTSRTLKIMSNAITGISPLYTSPAEKNDHRRLQVHS